jgi:hypothetical protein
MQRSERVLAAAVLLIAALVLAAYYVPVPPRQENFGYTPDPEGVAEFLKELDQPLFAQAGADAIRQAKGEDTFLYRALYKAHQARYGKPFIVGEQGIGDCVSWGWAHGVWIAQAIDWDLGRLPEPPMAPATESIYGGSRVEARNKPEGGGGWSDGSYGGAAARWCRDWGVIYREPIEGHDLTAYSAKRAKDWGNYGNGGQGDGGKLDAEAKRHPAQYVSLVKTWAEAAAAIESGYPVVVCSMQGFNSIRDADGFCKASGQWAHCMCFIAVRYGSRPGLLCLNSWGPSYVGGPRWPDDQPEGSFWVEKSVADRMLSGGDSFAVGSIDGFGFRDLHHGNWFEPPPRLRPETVADDEVRP